MTVPLEVRRALCLKEGDTLMVSFDETTGRITVETPLSVIERTAGAFKPKRPVSSDIYELVAEEKRLAREEGQRAAIERDERSRDS
jgi:bifunctional DNA-binding transcriptional regulator/antitoxin component of YhaV-PrlF toxin-antitoxin module